MSNNFYNFFPTKAEEEAAAAAAAAAAGSSSGQTTVSSSEAEVDNWTITKAISSIDIERLLLQKGGRGGTEVEDNILCYLHPEIAANALAGKPAIIKVKDVDTGDIISNMIITREPKTNKFYLRGHWTKEFVLRRDLHVGHQIGLRWNVEEHYLEFSKLN